MLTQRPPFALAEDKRRMPKPRFKALKKAPVPARIIQMAALSMAFWIARYPVKPIPAKLKKNTFFLWKRLYKYGTISVKKKALILHQSRTGNLYFPAKTGERTMKHLRFFFFILILLLFTGCTNASPATTTASLAVPTATTGILTPTFTIMPPTATWTLVPSATPDQRYGILTLVENDVQIRVRPGEAFQPAVEGQKLFVGGEIITNADSRAELHLLPEDTIVRINANTHFVLKKREPTTATTSLKLLFGKIWIILKGGSLDVETPNGVASVRGSIMSVEYYPDQQTVTVVCLEGHCTFSHAENTVEMTTGQMISINPMTPKPVSTPETLPPEEYKHEKEQLETWDEQTPKPYKTPMLTKTPRPNKDTLTPTATSEP